MCFQSPSILTVIFYKDLKSEPLSTFNKKLQEKFEDDLEKVTSKVFKMSKVC